MTWRHACSAALWTVFQYETTRVVTIRSVTTGFINRFIQLTIIAYIIGYVLVYKKGYQMKGAGQSTTTTKLKGVASTNSTQFSHWPPQYHRIWDTADYVIPAQMNDAVFVMTNAIITPKQRMGQCAEYPGVSATVLCNPMNNTCQSGIATENGNGVMTGRCIVYNKTVNTCEIDAWCPVEVDNPTHHQDKIPLLGAAANFTMFIKNFVEFPSFGTYKKRNIIGSINNATYLQTCIYSDDKDPYCPKFQLNHIVEMTGDSFEDIAMDGAIVSILITWQCDLDWDLTYCKPTYTFRRLDDKDAKIARGWNFRFSKEYQSDGISTRDLYKAYGILFVFDVSATAGKFNVVPLATNIGSGLALLVIASVICDIIVLYLAKDKRDYRDNKYLTLLDRQFADILGEGFDSEADLFHSSSDNQHET